MDKLKVGTSSPALEPLSGGGVAAAVTTTTTAEDETRQRRRRRLSSCVVVVVFDKDGKEESDDDAFLALVDVDALLVDLVAVVEERGCLIIAVERIRKRCEKMIK